MFPWALKTFEQNSSHPSIVSRWRVCWGPTLVLDILHYGIGLHWLIHFKVCNGEKEKQIHPQKMQQWRSVLVFFFLRIFLFSWICWSSRDIEWNWYNLSIANSYHRFETVRQRNIFSYSTSLYFLRYAWLHLRHFVCLLKAPRASWEHANLLMFAPCNASNRIDVPRLFCVVIISDEIELPNSSFQLGV